jgi:hypothetical protein
MWLILQTSLNFHNLHLIFSFCLACRRRRLRRHLRRDPLALRLVHRPVRPNARGSTEEHLQAAGALLEPRAVAAGISAVGARLQVRGLFGWGALLSREVSRRAAVLERGLCVCAML